MAPTRTSFLPLAVPLLLAVAVIGCGGTGAAVQPPGQPSPATVSSTVPGNAALSVATNGKITITFSESMDPASITPVTVTLVHGARPVPLAVTSSGTAATMAPVKALIAYTTYTATVSTGAKALSGRALAVPFSWIFTTGAGLDTTPPTVSATVPGNAATMAAINGRVIATFSEAMAPASLTATTFTLTQDGTPVPVAVTSAGAVACMAPTSPLASFTTYTARLSSGAKDLAGNALAAPFSWSFTTGLAPDITPPAVSSTAPGGAARTVAINGKVAATFTEAMDPASISTASFTLTQAGTPVPVAVTGAGAVATLAPISALTASTTYSATISTGVRDLAGNALAAPSTWSFTTGPAPDTSPPKVAATDPAGLATGVVVNRNLIATFSEGMDAASLTSATVTLQQGTTLVPASVTSMGAVVTLVPTTALEASTAYTATISTGVKDLAGNSLVAPFTWSFSTGAATAAGPSPIALGMASTFVILSRSGITDVPTSHITGDVGTSPITGAALAVPCAEVVGAISTVDAAGPAPCSVLDPVFLTSAVADMEIAYADAAGRVTSDFTELGAGNVDGMLLAPGLYAWSSSLSIPSGVTLAGGPNDVWIFQIAQDLTVADGAVVSLMGGAQAGNIFWQVAGQATIGAAATVQGTILSKTLVSMKAGAVLTGRALAQTAVTLQSNTLTRP